MKLFIDMDGVLCQFAECAVRLHGRSDLAENYPSNRWDIAGVLGISEKEFWAAINEAGSDWWANLPQYPEAGALVAMADKLVGRNWLICSAPSRDHQCVAGKVRWVRNHLDFSADRYIFTSRKELLARPDRILVDDNETNCARWADAGGRVILWPQPWNSLGRSGGAYLTAFEQLEKMVKEDA